MIAVVTLLFYMLIYLFATGQIIIDGFEDGDFLKFAVLNNWQDLLFKQRSAFLFEFFGYLNIGPIKIFLSLPNILISFLLGILVSLNISVSYFSFKKLGLKGKKGITSLLGTIPAIVSGVTCCVPTLILVIGLQFTATLAAFWAWLVPLSFLLLFATLIWSLKKIQRNKI